MRVELPTTKTLPQQSEYYNKHYKKFQAPRRLQVLAPYGAIMEKMRNFF